MTRTKKLSGFAWVIACLFAAGLLPDNGGVVGPPAAWAKKTRKKSKARRSRSKKARTKKRRSKKARPQKRSRRHAKKRYKKKSRKKSRAKSRAAAVPAGWPALQPASEGGPTMVGNQIKCSKGLTPAYDDKTGQFTCVLATGACSSWKASEHEKCLRDASRQKLPPTKREPRYRVLGSKEPLTPKERRAHQLVKRRERPCLLAIKKAVGHRLSVGQGLDLDRGYIDSTDKTIRNQLIALHRQRSLGVPRMDTVNAITALLKVRLRYLNACQRRLGRYMSSSQKTFLEDEIAAVKKNIENPGKTSWVPFATRGKTVRYPTPFLELPIRW